MSSPHNWPSTAFALRYSSDAKSIDDGGEPSASSPPPTNSFFNCGDMPTGPVFYGSDEPQPMIIV